MSNSPVYAALHAEAEEYISACMDAASSGTWAYKCRNCGSALADDDAITAHRRPPCSQAEIIVRRR